MDLTWIDSRQYHLWQQANALVFRYAAATAHDYTPRHHQTCLKLSQRSARRYAALKAIIPNEMETAA